MSSFPVLNLPLIALRNVGDYWNPIDWYQFSKVSQKTKGITKSLSKSIDFVGLRCGSAYGITLNYRKPDLIRIHDTDESYEFRIEEFEEHSLDEWYSWCKNPVILSIPSENQSIDVLHAIDHILEIFKCQLTDVSMFADGLTHVQFNYFINWSNSLKQESIESVLLATSNRQYLGDFLSKFKKPTGFLRTLGYDCKEPKFSDFHCQSIHDVGAHWIALEQLLKIDFVSCDFKNTCLTNKDVNTFLKSWKGCKTHSRMEKCTLEIKETPNWKTILEGLSPEDLHDNGGPLGDLHHNGDRVDCQIKRNDGKIAKIELRSPDRISINVL